MSNKKLVLVATIIFVVVFGVIALYMWKNKFTISETGSLGDAVNGLIAPFITFAAAILVYLSFNAQIQANKLITSQWEFDTFLKLFNEIENKYKALEIKVTVKGRTTASSTGIKEEKEVETHKGYDYFEFIEQNYSTKDSAVSDWLVAPVVMLEELNSLIIFVRKSNINDKLLVYNKINIFYKNYLEKPIISMSNRLPKNGKPYEEFLIVWIKVLELIKEMQSEWIHAEMKKQDKSYYID